VGYLHRPADHRRLGPGSWIRFEPADKFEPKLIGLSRKSTKIRAVAWMRSAVI
jgi:hypothetical protein